jgi:CRISPR/Cas system-associated exonuclease Cas4 (RecB family)
MHSGPKKLKPAANLGDRWDLSTEDVFDLAGAYKTYLAKIHSIESRPGVFHPSALGMCGRHNVYEYLGYDYDAKYPDTRVAEIFFLGQKIHEFLQERITDLKQVGFTQFRALHEVPSAKDDFLLRKFGLGGTSDTLLEISLGKDSQRGVIEFKSIGAEGFKEVKSANTPKPQHLEQIHIYMYRFNCPVGWVWYYGKNTSESHVIPVVFDDTVFHEALDKVLSWKAAADSGKLPDREESWFGCRDCKYRNVCKPSILRRKSTSLSTLRSKNAKTRR